ncbi:MAG: TIGR02099 family protein [Rhodanobacter sp.]|nr:MAG: TIGR02099 family protein [Rhodanobacter sp.]
MNAPWWRRGARVLGWTAGVSVILLALLAALAQLLLPLLAQHPQWVAAQLSQQLKRPVSFASMEGRWTASGPVFVMHGVTVGAVPPGKGNALQIPEAELQLDFGGWLLPSRHLLNLHVQGLQLDLLHDASGKWHVNGLGLSGQSHAQPVSLGPLSVDLWLEHLRIVVTDTGPGKQYTLLARQLRLSRHGSEIRFGGVLRREGVATALHMAGRFQEDGRSGRVWLGADGVDLKPLLDGMNMEGYTADRGRGRLAVWLDWRKGQLTRCLLRLDLDKVGVTAPDGATASVASLHGLAGLQLTADGYDVRWAGDDDGAMAAAVHQPGTAKLEVGVAARELQLAPLLPWLALKPELAPGLAHWLGSGNPRGDLVRVGLRWSGNGGLQMLDLAFRQLSIEPVGKLPGVSNLQGELRGDMEAVSLRLPAQATTLQFPQLFQQPLVLNRLQGTMAFWRQDDDWHLGADPLDFDGAGYAGQVRGQVVLPAQGGAPFLDLYASLDHADVTSARLFWPIHAMSPGTIQWLDHALVSGTITQAQALVRGNLADWPFRQHEGRFEAQAVIHDLTFDYGKNWPRAEGVDAVARFVNNGMLVQASDGQALGVKIDKAVALIPDFGDGLLDLNMRGSGRGGSLMRFIRKSPIGSHQADTLGKLTLGGRGTFNFHLIWPLKDRADVQLDGAAQLVDADLSAPDWKLHLGKLNGPMTFDLHGLNAGPLATRFRGEPATLKLTLAGANSNPGTVLAAHLQGRYQLAELVQQYPALDWLGQAAKGRSDFDIGYMIFHRPGSPVLGQMLSVDSSLNGMRLDFPAPLDKPATVSLPLHLTMALPVTGSELQLSLGQVLRGRLRLPTETGQPLAGSLAFGDQMPQTLPPRDLRIRGHADRLDVTGWVQRAAAGGSGSGPGLESIDIGTGNALWFGRSLGAMKIRATPQADRIVFDVDGKAMVGNVQLPTRNLRKRGITARLQRLYWPQGAPAPHAAPTSPSPSTRVDSQASAGVDPAALPPLHLWIGDLRLGKSKLGEARLETWPTTDGMHIEQLRALSSSVQINASGDWNGNASNSRTHMRIGFAAKDLGAMLTAFGYRGLVDDGKTNDQLDATWPGPPSDLSLANMTGTLSIHVTDGHIPDVSSGVGRLLGLVSLTELPRRLTLDFGDVFGKGLAFDSITGKFQLADGNATTSNLSIKGPAANISISGRTGLRARDYDQQVRVVPHIGNSLPLVGAVVGGPVGAAAGLAVQGLLGKGLNQAASARYRVTGTWDKPVMTLVEKKGEAVTPTPPLSYPASPAAPANRAAPATSSTAGH